ncbi:MAG: hypothetical protein HY553_11085 [Elusimicrobia bacterium]|nr:hypothetical protein [Elusimicrobiota bacterium]
MSQDSKWNVFRVVAAVLFLGMVGAMSCGPQGDTGGGDKTKPKGTSGPCG